jgi:hypothetical protein
MTQTTQNDHLLPVLSQLYKQIKAFGVLMKNGDEGRDAFSKFVLRRASFLKSFFGVVETEDYRSKIVNSDPILYNTADWPRESPPAGKFRQARSLSLEQHLNSYILFWHFQTKDGSRLNDAVSAKVCRASLWLCREDGFLAALEYVIDLLMAGVIIDPRVCYQVFRMLLDARRRVVSVEEIIDPS